MKKLSLGFLLLVALCAPSFVNAATQASKDFDDQGLALFNKGLYSKSVEYFQDAVQADSSNWQAYEDLGNAYAQLNQTQNALDAYQNSLGLNPNNQTVRDAVTNLGGNPDAASSPAQAPVRRDHSRAEVKQAISGPGLAGYGDGLPYMDHAKVWTKAEIGYNNSALTDLFTSASTINGIVKDYGYTGLAKADNSGYQAGAEVGLLLNPNNGLAFGIRFIKSNLYTSNIDLQNGGDFEDESFQPYLVPVTLDYYFFIPEKAGRFFITAGVGYYASMVHVEDNYDYSISSGVPNYDQFGGDLYGSSVGFQFGIGHDFAINDHFGLEIFGRGRYAKITNYQGTVSGPYGNAQVGLLKYADGEVHASDVSNISSGDGFATLDYTGFDVGVGFTFF